MRQKKKQRKDTKKFKIDKGTLDSQHDEESICICKNRIQGAFPVYMP